MSNEEIVKIWDAEAEKLAESRRWAAAARVLSRAAKAEPHDAARWLQIAEWQVQDGDVSAAIRTLERALKINEEANSDAQISLLLGLAETHLGAQNWDAGAQACREILKRQTRHHAALELLATAHLQTNQLDAAIEVMQRLLAISPRDPLHRLKLATLMQLQGELGASSREFQRVLETHGDFPFANDANEAVEALDRLQTQQILMLAAEQNNFRLNLERHFDAALAEGGFHLSESGRESLRHMVADLTPSDAAPAPRVH